MIASCQAHPNADADVGRMVAALLNPLCYPHPVQRLELLETHISWVILTGEYAYKIKKPVNLRFVDFTSLALRRYYCEEELRLNRRLSSTIYLGVVAITGNSARPRIGGAGEVIEYAVKMRQFPQPSLLSATLARGELTESVVAKLAQKIAEFHETVPSAESTPAVDATASILTPALDNFGQMLPFIPSVEDAELLLDLREWTEREYRNPVTLLYSRLARSRVRECHGDLHLGNIVMVDGEPTPFDCIEFNAGLRWIDVMSEVAFLMMDLEAHERHDLAYVFLNTYLERTGDYDGVSVLPFYRVYRALVRAKISLLQAGDATAPVERHQNGLAAFKRYLTLAVGYVRPHRGAVIITHGLSGSGKTWLTSQVMSPLRAVRIRSDIERKRQHGLSALAQSASGAGAGIYAPDASVRTYEHLACQARHVARAGFPVIVDAAFLRRRQRDAFRALAVELQVPFVILDMEAESEVLQSRILDRAAHGTDASEATLAVLEAQMRDQEPLTNEERADAIELHTGSMTAGNVAALCDMLAKRVSR